MIVGLVLILLGALAIVAALFTADGTNVELLGTTIGPMAMFFIGLGAGVAILWGFTLTKWGTKRSLRQRRENKKLGELSQQLDKREADRRDDESDDDRSI